MTPNWSEHHNQTKSYPRHSQLLEALEYVKSRGKAIDVGAGNLNDACYLLEHGFDVIVVDIEKSILKIAEEINSSNLHCHISSFADFDFPQNTFDFVSAMFSLPFNPPDTFDMVFANIKQSLTKGGIFCGQFFGPKDEWSSNPNMTVHSKEQVESLLADMEVISIKEVEKDATLADGSPHHWHVFHVIAKRYE